MACVVYFISFGRGHCDSALSLPQVSYMVIAFIFHNNYILGFSLLVGQPEHGN
jgi:hypothetical protein